MNRRNLERRAAAGAGRRAIETAERKIKEIVTVIENGGFQPSLIDRLNELERQKRESEARLKDGSEDLPDLHPAIAETYRTKIERLTQALAEPETSPDAAEAIRSLVGRVILTPGVNRGQVEAFLHGELAAILELMVERKKSLTPAGELGFQWLRG